MIKKILLKFSDKNFRANAGLLLATIAFFAILVVKSYAHIELHSDINLDAEQMFDKSKDKSSQIDSVTKMYDDRKESIEKWAKDDPYCDNDLKNKVLEKTNEQEKRDINIIKNNDYTLE